MEFISSTHQSRLTDASSTESLVQRFQDLTLVDAVSEIIAELGMMLKRFYNEHRHAEFAKQTRHLWDGRRGQMFTLKSSAPPTPHCSKLYNFCNKLTMLYWAQSAQEYGHCPLLIFGCIYKEWFRHDSPNIEFGHFFANPIRVTSTGPTTIFGILQAHRSLCDQVSVLLGKIERGEIGKPYMSVWPNTRNFKFLPICRAIVVILDELSPEEDVGGLDARIYLDEEMPRQSIVLVLTGDDSGLSAPVTFDSLRAQSLPLARADCTASDNDIDVIRVSLALAVRFVADLERREEAAFPETRSSTIDGSICPSAVSNGPSIHSANEWANQIIKQAVDKEKENVCETRHVLQRIQAVKRGEEDSFGPELPLFDTRQI